MKSVKTLVLALLIGGALSIIAKGEGLAASDAFVALEAMDDIKQCQETLKNLERLIKLSQELVVSTQVKADRHEKNADAQADYLAASKDYDKLVEWRARIAGRIQYDRLALQSAGITGWEEGRQSAKDAARDARESSTDAARQTGTDAARDAHGMVNCKDGH